MAGIVCGKALKGVYGRMRRRRRVRGPASGACVPKVRQLGIMTAFAWGEAIKIWFSGRIHGYDLDQWSSCVQSST
jgi:hypothetical protein